MADKIKKIQLPDGSIYDITAIWDELGNKITEHYATKQEITGLSKVATSGSYNDLSNKPTIPTTAAQVGADVSGSAANALTNAKAYTDSQIDAMVGDETVANQITTAIVNKSDSNHTHDDRYYTETEIDAKLNGKSDTSHGHSTATTSTAGFMSASDKSKLDGIATNANNYTHPTSSGNKHIPSGGSSGQILRWSSDGTAVWGADNNTTYSNATTSAAGLMSSSDKSKLDSIASNANNYTHPSSHPASMITGLSTVATSGSYNDLSNKPTIPTTAAQVDAVPTSRTINGKALSSNITLSASDVGALPAQNGTLPITAGGTGATDAATARSNLGITPANIGAAPAGFGLGSVSPRASDLNVSAYNGWFYTDAETANRPTNYAMVLNMYRTGTQQAQIATSIYGDAFVRGCNSGTWSDWEQILTTKQIDLSSMENLLVYSNPTNGWMMCLQGRSTIDDNIYRIGFDKTGGVYGINDTSGEYLWNIPPLGNKMAWKKTTVSFTSGEANSNIEATGATTSSTVLCSRGDSAMSGGAYVMIAGDCNTNGYIKTGLSNTNTQSAVVNLWWSK